MRPVSGVSQLTGPGWARLTIATRSVRPRVYQLWVELTGAGDGGGVSLLSNMLVRTERVS